MNLKALMTIALLAVAPTVALAAPEGCHGDHDQQAMTCVQGFVWNAVTGFCVAVTTS